MLLHSPFGCRCRQFWQHPGIATTRVLSFPGLAAAAASIWWPVVSRLDRFDSLAFRSTRQRSAEMRPRHCSLGMETCSAVSQFLSRNI